MTELVCRLCDIDIRQHGTLQHVHSIFKGTIAVELQRVGVHVIETPFKSHLICQGCYRQIPRLQRAYDCIQKWKAAVSDDSSFPLLEAAVQQPKRCRGTLTPTKTPRKSKRVATSKESTSPKKVSLF